MPAPNMHEGVEYKVEKNHFDVLETLPRKLREMLYYAEFPYSVTEIAVFLERLKATGIETDRAADIVYERFSAMNHRKVANEVLDAYGPEHPQARKP